MAHRRNVSVCDLDKRIGDSPDRAANDDAQVVEDRFTWPHLFIISAEAASPDLNAAQPLLQTQTDIGDAVTPLYGDAAEAQFAALLRTHILTAGDCRNRGARQLGRGHRTLRQGPHPDPEHGRHAHCRHRCRRRLNTDPLSPAEN
jgi:hypothetical protein